MAGGGRELLERYQEVAGPQGAAAQGPIGAPHLAGVRIESGRELTGLLLLEPVLSCVRLVAATSLLGSKACILVPRLDPRDVVAWDVRVLWAMRLADDLFENGAMLLEPSAKGRWCALPAGCPGHLALRKPEKGAHPRSSSADAG